MTTQFDNAAFVATLQKTFAENGLSKLLSYERVQAFTALTARMLEENGKFNLTAINEPEKIALLHYVDCALIAQYLPHGAQVVDIGCGAGFPSLPLAIVRPDIMVTAIDSTDKKVQYVATTAEMLSLGNIECETLRAEDGAKDIQMRERFDIVVSRAVASLRILAELCLPYAKVGGEMIAMKGKNAAYELSEAKKAISLMGGELISLDETPLRSATYGEQNHTIIRIKKQKKSPVTYPRLYAQILKKPL